MHRADQLLQQQQQADTWKFKPMARTQYQGLMPVLDERYEHVYDPDKGGIWYRKKPAMPESIFERNNRDYTPRRTRFGDMLDGFSDILTGIRKLDQASDGDIGEGFFEAFRHHR